jgi:uncharacterized protein involved in cysteine biosynthesis
MNDVTRALGNAFRAMLHPRMLALAVWPMLVALVVWIGLAWVFWDSWSQWLSAAIASFRRVAMAVAAQPREACALLHPCCC